MADVARKEFGLPHRTITGPGTLSEAGAEVLRLGTRAFIGCGQAAMRASGVLDALLHALNGAGVECVVFDEIEGNPSTRTVDEGVQIARHFGADVLVALGGGSAMDAVKMMAWLVHNDGSASEYLMGNRAAEAPGLPVVAVPSTSGTGSEANHIAVITDEGSGIKKGARIPDSVPRVVILDPAISAHMPAELTAHTGLDALAHATESYLSTGATPLSRALSLKAVERIGVYLPRAIADGEDLEVRMEMALASYMAGAGLMAGVGLCHEMAMALGSFQKDHHGMLVARLMVPAMAVSRDAAAQDICTIAVTLGRDGTDVDAALDGLGRFVGDFVHTAPLSEFGYTVEDIPEILRISKISTNITTNPEPLDDAIRTAFLTSMIEQGK